MNYSKKQQAKKKLQEGVNRQMMAAAGGGDSRGGKGKNNFSSPPRTNILKCCAAYKRGQRKKQDEAAAAVTSYHFEFSQLERAFCHMCWCVCVALNFLLRPTSALCHRPLSPSRCVAYKCPESDFQTESGSGSGLVPSAVTFVLRAVAPLKVISFDRTQCSSTTTSSGTASTTTSSSPSKVKVKVNPSAKIQYFMH